MSAPNSVRVPAVFVSFLASILVLASLSSSASAEPGAEAEPSPATEVMVITATREPTPQTKVASSTSVITAADIERRQLRLVTDALRYVPGVDIRRTGGAGTTTSIFMRGADSDHVLVLLDGVELNDPSSPSRLPLLDHLTTEDIERIEVVRGPQSGLYGGDAIGGVIQIFTKRGADDLSAVASAEGGSYGTGRGAASLTGGNGDVRYAASASHWDSKGFSATSAGSERDGYRNTSASGRLSWDPTTTVGVDASIRFSDARVEFDGSVEPDHFTHSQQILARVAPRVELFDGAWEQVLSGQFARNERKTTSLSPSASEGDLYGIGWRNTLHVLDDHTLSFGVENEWEEARFSAFKDSRYTLGIYAQDQIELFGRFFGTLGVRLDDADDFKSRVTYRMTAGADIPELLSVVRASYGTGFKAPSLSELNTTAFAGNPNLDPETSRGFDIGFESTLCEGHLVAGATFFYNDIDDLIIAVFNPLPGIFVNYNVDRSKAHGVEAALTLAPASWFEARGNYTYTRTEVQGAPAGFGIADGSRLLRRPDHKASLELVLRVLEGRGELSTTLNYVGRRRDLDPVTFTAAVAPAFATVDLNASFDLTEHVEVFARVENVFDKDYEDVLGFQTPGVSAYAGARLRF